MGLARCLGVTTLSLPRIFQNDVRPICMLCPLARVTYCVPLSDVLVEVFGMVDAEVVLIGSLLHLDFH